MKASLAVAFGFLPFVACFAPSSLPSSERTLLTRTRHPEFCTIPTSISCLGHSHPFEVKALRRNVNIKSTNREADESISNSHKISINPPYALAYIVFLAFAYAKQAGESEGASMEILQQYIANPLNPGFNELFITVFNLLGLYAAPFACLLMPGARGQKLPAAPFLLGSMFGGYGVLGIYASVRNSNPSPVSRSELDWFTANILENKLFNYLILALVISAYISSGAAASFGSNPVELIQGYVDLLEQGSAIVSASSLDFFILTLAAASFIPEDLSRRDYKGDLAPELIALSTLVFPGVGVALYCALRPRLDE